MDFQAIVVGLFALLIGLAFTFVGFQLFLVLLPIWGFFAGLYFGAEMVTVIFGTGFLADVTGWVVGIIAGLIFAVVSYLWYWLAVIVLGASVGYGVGIALAGMVGINDNALSVIIGIVVAVLFALAAIWLRLPKYLAIAFTAIGGAFAAVLGVAVLLSKVPVSAVGSGSFGAIQDLNWVWLAAAVILAIVGIVWQMRVTNALNEITYETYRNPGRPEAV